MIGLLHIGNRGSLTHGFEYRGRDLYFSHAFIANFHFGKIFVRTRLATAQIVCQKGQTF